MGTTLRKFTMLMAVLLVCLNANASVDKFRVMFNGNASYEATVGFNTVNGNNPILYYSTSYINTNQLSNYDSKAPDASNSYITLETNFVRLSNLAANTKYYFVIQDSNSTSDVYYFETVSDNPLDRLSIIAGGDSRNNRTPRQYGNMLVSKLKPHVVMFGGDMTDNGSTQQWKDWLDDWQLSIDSDNRITPIIATRGNHEANDVMLTQIFDIPATNYFTVTLGGNLLKIFTLNSEGIISGNQTTWLENSLINSSNFIWKFAQYHKPMRPHVSYKAEGSNQYAYWSDLFYNHNVDVVVECDAHTVKTTWPVIPCSGGLYCDEGFERDDANGTVYVGEGCWGAPLRTNDDGKLWTRNGGSFNSFKLMFIGQGETEIRTIKLDNAPSVGSVTLADRFTLPLSLDVWTPANGAVVTIAKAHPDAPTIAFTNPQNNDTFYTFDPLSINVNASDLNGTVTDVEFFVDGVSQGVDNTLPFQLNSWNPSAFDVYQISAIATDNDGLTSEMATINIQVLDPSFQSVTASINASSDDAEEGINASVNTSNYDIELVYDTYLGIGDQTVGFRFTNVNIPPNAIILDSYMQFTADEVNFGAISLNISGEASSAAPTFSNIPYNISSRPRTSTVVNWSPADWTSQGDSGAAQRTTSLNDVVQEIVDQPGFGLSSPIVLIVEGSGERTAESYDGDSENAAKLVIEYSINVSTNNPPSVNLTLPNNGQSFTTANDIELAANAFDTDGTIANVQFFINGTLVNTDNTSPYSYNAGTLTTGSYSIMATATDNNGASASSAVNINIAAALPPDVYFVTPNNNQNFVMTDMVSLNAIATDVDGNIMNVRFYENDIYNLINTDGSTPYETMYSPSTTGSINLLAVATDDDGMSTMTTIAINVNDACTAPYSFTATNFTETSAVVSWQGDGGPYEMQYRKSGTTNWTSFVTPVSLALLNNLDSCTTYEYRLRTNCAAGNSTFSGIQSFTTIGCQAGCPAIAGLFNSNVLSNSAVLAWDIIPFSTYEVYYRQSGAANWLSYSTSIPLILLFGLNSCATYEWYVVNTCFDGSLSLNSNIKTFTTACKNSIDDNISFNETHELNMQTYPIPMNNYLNVEFELPNNDIVAEITLLNISGKLIDKTIVAQPGKQNIQFYTSNLPKGVYLVSLNDGKSDVIQKVIKN